MNNLSKFKYIEVLYTDGSFPETKRFIDESEMNFWMKTSYELSRGFRVIEIHIY